MTFAQVAILIGKICKICSNIGKCYSYKITTILMWSGCMEKYDSFCKRLREVRHAKNLTEKETGLMLSKSQDQYSRIEIGETIMNYFELKQLQKNDFDVDYLITGNTSKKQKMDIIEIYDKYEQDNREQFLELLHWAIKYASPKRHEEEQYKIMWQLFTLTIFGEKNLSLIEQLRKILKINQWDFAEELGVNIKKFRQLEKEKIMPDAYIICTIYEKYNCLPSILLSGDEAVKVIIEKIWQQLDGGERKEIVEILQRNSFEK